MVLSDNEITYKIYRASGAFCVFLVLKGVVDLPRGSHIQRPKTCSKPCRQIPALILKTPHLMASWCTIPMSLFLNYQASEDLRFAQAAISGGGKKSKLAVGTPSVEKPLFGEVYIHVRTWMYALHTNAAL